MIKQLTIEQRYLDRSPNITRYFAEIDREPLLTVSEEIILAERISNGDKEAVQKLIKANLRFVYQ